MRAKSKRFSQSAFWQAQPYYYQEKGVSAWSSDVPYHITSSTHFCRSYADIVASYMHDVLRNDANATFCFIELGAASGKFSYRLLQYLEQFCDQLSIRTDCIRYIMCDCADSILDYWKIHPQLAPYVECDMLYFSKLLLTSERGVNIDADSHLWDGRYVIMFGNYFFDSIYQDAYCIQDQQVYPYLSKDPVDKKISSIDHIKFSADLTKQALDADSHRDSVAQSHLAYDIERFLLPTGCFDLIDYFNKDARQILMLSSDKGFNNFDYGGYDEKFNFVIDGTISTVVNYFAIDAYVRSKYQGDGLLSPAQSLESPVFFSTGIFLTHGSIDSYQMLYKSAMHYLDYSYHSAQHCITRLNISSYLANSFDVLVLLQTQYHDPFLVMKLSDLIDNILRNCRLDVHGILGDNLKKLTKNCYYTNNTQELREFVATASLLLSAKSYSDAKAFIDTMTTYYGFCYQTHLLYGSYYYLQESADKAQYHFEQTLQLKPDCDVAKHYLYILTDKLVP